MRTLAVILVIALGLGVASARGMRSWSYKELVEASDVIAIITPSKTLLRKEKAPLPDMTGVEGQRVETEFTVVVMLKGSLTDPKHLLLHHYKDIRTGGIANGPLLVAFDPKEKFQYLAFLKKGADGQYTAVTGQTDPWFSYEKLQTKAF